MTTLERYEVRDRDRKIAFTGTLLGSASTYASGRERWSETCVYRTEAGQYVVTKIGRSIRAGEVDICTAHVAEGAEGAVEALFAVDDSGLVYLTRVNRRAAEAAGERDEEFRRAYLAEEVA